MSAIATSASATRFGSPNAANTPARHALQQLCAQLLLELSDLAADGGIRHPERAGRFSKAGFLHDADQHACGVEVDEAHGRRSLSKCEEPCPDAAETWT